jgi:hypothetical protein
MIVSVMDEGSMKETFRKTASERKSSNLGDEQHTTQQHTATTADTKGRRLFERCHSKNKNFRLTPPPSYDVHLSLDLSTKRT